MGGGRRRRRRVLFRHSTGHTREQPWLHYQSREEREESREEGEKEDIALGWEPKVSIEIGFEEREKDMLNAQWTQSFSVFEWVIRVRKWRGITLRMFGRRKGFSDGVRHHQSRLIPKIHTELLVGWRGIEQIPYSSPPPLPRYWIDPPASSSSPSSRRLSQPQYAVQSHYKRETVSRAR